MSGYKLYYHALGGRAQLNRLAFSAAGIEFEDIRLTPEEWVKEKASGRPPLGQMPFIVTPEGKLLACSVVIAKYICKQGGLTPKDSFEEALADMITDGTQDLFNTLGNIFYEKDEARKLEMHKELYENTLPARLQKFEAILKGRNEGKGFFMGDKLTYPDVFFFNLMNVLAQREPAVPDQLEKFPLLVEHYKRVMDVPGVRAWVDKPMAEK